MISGHQLTRITGPLFVGGATALITMVVYVYFMEILPGLLGSRKQTVLFYFTRFDLLGDLLYSMYITYSIYFHFYKCISMDPGSPRFPTIGGEESINGSSSSSSSNYNDEESAAINIDITTRWGYCKKCKRPKPPRCHHCNVCNKCVLKMDHHCPWMANCMGYRNYRHFILFLINLWIGSFHLVIHSSILFHSTILFTDRFDELQRYLIILSTVMAALLLIVVGAFTGFHMYLISTGQTTIENIDRGRDKKNYNLGWKRNWQELLGKGTFWFSGVLPVETYTYGDGLYFVTREAYIQRRNRLDSITTI